MDPQSSAIEFSVNKSEREIYLAAVRISDPDDRHAFLNRVCQGNQELRSRIERLIAAKEQGHANPLQKAVDRSGTRHEHLPLSAAHKATFETGTVTAISTIDITDQPMIGRYQLLEEIGRDGMGTVYKAQQYEPVRRQVAVKVINPGMNSREILARFEAERQVLAMMDHPNIASVFDGGTTDSGLPYFAMELVRGVRITRYCREKSLSLGDRLSLFVKLCHAIHHAHQRGIIHRDLKPSNILVAEHEHTPIIKVIDFGVAKALHGELADRTLLTKESQLLGTPIYMSPEQAISNDSTVDIRCDVYSLGVVLYELLTGTTPIDPATLARMGFEQFCQVVTQRDPQRPSERLSLSRSRAEADTRSNRGVPTSLTSKQLKRELDWIVMKAIDRDRDKRYASASALAEDLNRLQNGEPVVACPPSITYRMRKTASQNRVALGILAVIMVALAAVAITSRWQISAVELARQETEVREQRAIDLLHAIKLQRALTAFQNENLLQLHELTSELSSDPLLLSGQNRPTDFIELLSEVANRPARASFSNGSPVHDLAATPDRKVFVSVDDQGDVKLWAMNSPEDGGILLGTHDEPAHAVAISPDGRAAVTGSTTGFLKLWNLVDRKHVRTLRVAESGIETLRWSPDGGTIAAGSRYSEVWVGDQDGNERFRIPNDHRHESLLFSADSSELIVPNREDLGVFDVSTGQKRRSIATQPLENVRTLCFAGENDQWVIAGERYRENLVVLDYAEGKLLGQIPLGHSYPRAITASNSGLWLRVSYSGGFVQVIQLSPSDRGQSATGKIWSVFRAHAEAPDDRLPLAFLQSENLFLSGGSDGQIHLWDHFDLRTVEIHRRPKSIQKSYLNSKNGEIQHVHLGKTDPFLSQTEAFSEQCVDGKFAVALKNKIVLVRLSDQHVIGEIDSPISDHRDVAVSDAGNTVLAGSDTSLCIWRTSPDWSEHELLNQFEIKHTATPIFCDQGRTIIVDDDDSDQLLAIDIDTRSTKKIADAPRVKHLCLDPSNRRLGIAFTLGFMILDRDTSEMVFQAENVGRMGQIRFTHDGTILLDARQDGHIHVWHLPTKQKLGLLYRPDFAIGSLMRWQSTQAPPRMMFEFADDYGGTHLLVTPGGSRR